MVFGLLGGLARVRVTVAYAVIVTGVTTALLSLGPEMQNRIIRHASTNLHNLSHGRIGTLVGSAFVVDAGPIYVWLPGLVCLLAVAELLWRSGRLVLAFGLGHIGATLLVALGLVTAVELGWLPLSVSRATDVGMSYGAAGVLGTLTAAIPNRWRPAWVGWWLAVAVTMAAMGTEFTDVGHALALLLGMAVSTRFGPPSGWTRLRYALFVVGAAFGYLVLASNGMLIATAAGLAGATVAECVVVARSRRKSAPHVHVRAAEPSAELMG
jgi:Rhomboid-like protein